ncbi:MAG: pyruvate formate lyase family protein, partial [Candidatus Brocadiia bacterium]
MDERIRSLSDHIDALNDAGVRRTTFYPCVAESLARTADEPTTIRRAKAFAHLLDEAAQVVLPHELLTGSILGVWPLADDLPDYAECRQEAVDALEAYRARKRQRADGNGGTRWALMARDHYDANVTYHRLQDLIAEMQQRFADAEDLSDAEIARELERHFQFDYGEEAHELMRELPWVVANHLDLNYQKVVARGLGDIRREILERRRNAEGPEQETFYTSTLIAVEAAIRFVERYAETLGEAAAAADTAPDRAAELRGMASVCRRVAERRPETFREALQLMWLVHIMANIGGGSALSFARFDQYMYPFYRKDLAEGVMTREEAKALVGCMWLKVNEPHMRTVQSLCLAGTRPDGADGANELTELCLEVCAELGRPYPNTSVRLSRASPDWLLDMVVGAIKRGFGQPMVLNDETWIPNFERLGYPIEDARDYYNMGCVEMMIMGKCPNWAGCGGVDFPACIELVFRNGHANMAGQTGPRTGTLESLQTFEQFMDAYLAQLRHRVGLARANAEQMHESAIGRHFDPSASALIDDCLEKGLDLFQGGSRHEPIRAIGGYGLGTAADSLSAIRKFVYGDGLLTLQEMQEALEADYAG